MTLAASARPTLPTRQEILDWYRSLARRGHHQILGVASGADHASLRAAFASLARRFHPDVLASSNGDLREEIHAIFTRITEAYQALSTAVPTSPQPVRAAGEPRPREQQASNEPRRRVEAPPEPETGTAGRGRGRLALARAYVADRRWLRYGVGLLEEVLRDEPGEAEALALLGAIFLREGLLARAEMLLARALVADPANARARSDLREARRALRRRREPLPERGEGRGVVSRLLSIAR